MSNHDNSDIHSIKHRLDILLTLCDVELVKNHTHIVSQNDVIFIQKLDEAIKNVCNLNVIKEYIDNSDLPQ